MSYPWINEAVVSDMTQSDQQAAAALTAMTVAATQLVPLWQIKVQGMTDGWWMNAQAATGSNPYAAAWFSYYDDPRFDNVDLTLPTSQTILAGLVSTALMTQGQSNNITAMSTTTVPKYGPVLWGDVTIARQALGLEQ